MLVSLPVPVSLRVFVKRFEHDGQDDVHVVTDKVAEVFVVPEVERTLSDERTASVTNCSNMIVKDFPR